MCCYVIYMSPYYYVCWHCQQAVCNRLPAAIYVLVLLNMCPCTAIYVSSYYYMWLRTTTYVSSYYYIYVGEPGTE